MIELTDAAISKAIEKTKDSGRHNIRLSVTPSGCAGYEYVIEFADIVDERDLVLDYGEFSIVIDDEAKAFFKGAQLDWVKEGLNEKFKIVNPNEIYSCGCGVSVTFE